MAGIRDRRPDTNIILVVTVSSQSVLAGYGTRTSEPGDSQVVCGESSSVIHSSRCRPVFRLNYWICATCLPTHLSGGGRGSPDYCGSATQCGGQIGTRTAASKVST